MMNKIVVMGVLLVVLSSFSAVAEEEDSCSGFFGMISCILWGYPSLRENLAGEAFGRNLAGGASCYVDCTASVSEGLCQLQGKLFYNKKDFINNNLNLPQSYHNTAHRLTKTPAELL